MTELHPCPACKRHVRGDACPFCGVQSTRREPIDLGMGRVSRAIVFASATLAVTASCAHRQKGVDDQGEERRGGPCIPPDEQKVAELEKRKAELAKHPDENLEEQRRVEEDLRAARAPNCAPYGAPLRAAGSSNLPA
jgi:hypothetical protein